MMARDPSRTVFIGNLDEKVTERTLYELLIQVGRVIDLHIPMDKITNRHKGYAFAEYETEEIAKYAVRLFSGLVSLHNKTLRFSMSGQDKQNASPATPKTVPSGFSSQERNQFKGSTAYSESRVNGSRQPPLIQQYPPGNVDRTPLSCPQVTRPLMLNNRLDSGRQAVDLSWINSNSSYFQHPVYPRYSR
ncbi:uncharacterized protein LOC144710948 isoform X2 [Wolffia australiana]